MRNFRSPFEGFRLPFGRRAGLASLTGQLAVYDMAAPGGYTLDSGRIDTWLDLTTGGRHLTNAIAADRPVVQTFVTGGDSAAFTSDAEWLSILDATLGGLPNDADGPGYEVDIEFEVTILGLNSTLVGWTKNGDNNPVCIIGLTTLNRLRYQRRLTSTTVRTVDSTETVTTGTVYLLTVSVAAGLLNMWLNGIQIVTDADAVGTVPDITCDRFAVGARVQTNPSLPSAARIQTVRVRAL